MIISLIVLRLLVAGIVAVAEEEKTVAGQLLVACGRSQKGCCWS